MQRGEPPAGSRVRYLRSEGWSYREIANYYGVSIPLAYALAHEQEFNEPDVARSATAEQWSALDPAQRVALIEASLGSDTPLIPPGAYPQTEAQSERPPVRSDWAS